MKARQLSLLPKPKKQHGGSLAVGKRRSLRPMSPKLSLHITLKSHHAIGGRCLFLHKKIIKAVMKKAAYLFKVRVYEYAIQGNHLHLLIKGPDRESLQNFFRVFAGHTAQIILKKCPLPPLNQSIFRTWTKSSGLTPDASKTFSKNKISTTEGPGGAPNQRKGCKKNQRKFWSYLLYTRIVTWGREFKVVTNYIQKNTLAALNYLAYQSVSRKLKANRLASTIRTNSIAVKSKHPDTS